MTTKTTTKTNMQKTQELGADFWNDSCALNELKDAVEQGAVGATSNPVIVLNAVQEDMATWGPVIEKLSRENPGSSEEEVAWKLIEEAARQAAALLAPVHAKTKGKKGFLSVQVNPRFHADAAKMTAQAKHLAALAPNIAIKIPATAAGVAAMEEVTAAGINVNATVSFSVSQAMAIAEAFERGMKRAKAAGKPMETLHPYVTIMVGRVDDHVKRVAEKEKIEMDPETIRWAGVAVFKKAYGVFREKGYSSTLLAAAYRHSLQWSELIGERVILSMPYKWWKEFNTLPAPVGRTIDKPVAPATLEKLLGRLPDFRKAYDVGAMKPADFERYGASAHTLEQFLGGYQKLLDIVRSKKA